VWHTIGVKENIADIAHCRDLFYKFTAYAQTLAVNQNRLAGMRIDKGFQIIVEEPVKFPIDTEKVL